MDRSSRRSKRRHTGPLEKLGRIAPRIIFGAVVVATPLFLGGSPPVVVVLVSGLLAMCAGLVVMRYDVSASTWRSLTVVACAVGALFTALQLLPVPLDVLKFASPGAYDVFTVGDAPPAAHPFSLDPPATALAFVRFIGLTAAALIGRVVYRRRPLELLTLVGVAAVVVVFVAVLHLMMGWHVTYGIYNESGQGLTSSFPNPNHFAGFCGFGVFACLAVAMQLRDERRWLPLGGAGICVAGVVLSMSRGGIIALTFAGLFLAALLVRRGERWRNVWPLLLAGGIASLMFLALSQGSLIDELATVVDGHDDIRLRLWQTALAVLPRFWLLGMGSGAFGLAFARYQPALDLTFTHTENQALQCLMDWGIVPGLVFLTLVAMLFARLVRNRGSDQFEPSLLAGFVFIGVHNFVDFNMWLLSVAIPVVACAAMCEGRRDSNKSREAGELANEISGAALFPVRGGKLVIAVATVSAFTVGAATWLALEHRLGRDIETLRLKVAAAPDSGARAEALHHFVAHHPADFLSRLIVADRELDDRGGAPRALKLINEAMQLAPSYSVVHRLAGRALITVGAYSQALIEYRLALDTNGGKLEDVVDEIIKIAPRHIQGLPGNDLDQRLHISQRTLAWGCCPQQVEDMLAIPELAHDERATEQLTRAALQAKNWELAKSRARVLESLQPRSAWPYEAEAQADRGLLRSDLAVAALQRGLAATSGAESTLSALADVLIERGELDQANEIATRLLTRTSTAEASANAHWLLASILVRQGRINEAIREIEHARDRLPKNPFYYLKLAELHKREGNLGLARYELERGLMATGGNPELRRMLTTGVY